MTFTKEKSGQNGTFSILSAFEVSSGLPPASPPVIRRLGGLKNKQTSGRGPLALFTAARICEPARIRSAPNKKGPPIGGPLLVLRGFERIRTAVEGFADLCLATRPRNHLKITLLKFQTRKIRIFLGRCKIKIILNKLEKKRAIYASNR